MHIKRWHLIQLASLFISCSLTLFPSCQKKSLAFVQEIDTFASKNLSYPDIDVPVEEELPQEAFPVAGTVSHHLLAGKQIDRWFKDLVARRKVKTFFVISPSHYGLSIYPWSLADCHWLCADKTKVETDSKKEKLLAATLGVSYEPYVFVPEHGQSTLMPFIAKYFPKAKVCSIALQGEPPLNQVNAAKLQEALQPFFTAEGAKENFLLISTDFSHHGNIEETVKKDARSRLFFENPSPQSHVLCSCDNRPGMYVLAHLLPSMTEKARASILFHTDSCQLSSGEWEEDITSYFFSYFY